MNKHEERKAVVGYMADIMDAVYNSNGKYDKFTKSKEEIEKRLLEDKTSLESFLALEKLLGALQEQMED